MGATGGTTEGDDRHRLRRLLQETPVVVNHALPLLRLQALAKHPFESIASQPMGDALTLPESTLSHSRAVRQLADLHRCEPTWEAVVSASESKRATGTYDAWIGTCLSDIETVVVDDALKDTEDMHSFTDMSVSVYTRSPCWRVVRVESVVEAAVEQLAARGTCSFAAVSDRVTKEFMTVMHDPHVVGFKSVIGKFSEMDYHKVKSVFETLLSDYLAERKKKGSSTPFRLSHAAVAQYFVEDAAILLCSANQKLPTDADRPPKVFQFHTGLGDTYCGLPKASSPLNLQGFIYEYPTTPIVILYAGYPFTREAAYLANTYSNVWVDIGGLFPYLSRRGQENAVHELLELAPWSKILAGTGGGYFPETYHLAQTQVKEVLETVVCEHVQKGDMSWSEAEDLVIGVLYQNANDLYKLGLPQRVRGQLGSISAVHSIRAQPSVKDQLQILEEYLEKDSSIQYLRVYWNDMTGTTRMRGVSVDYVRSRLKTTGEFFLGITTESLGILQNDTLPPGVHAVGEYKVYPDWSWMRLGPREDLLSTYGEFRESNGTPSPLCSRTSLKRVVREADSLKLEFLLGFELELNLMERTEAGISRNTQSDGHMPSSYPVVDRPIFAVIEKAIAYLRTIDVHVEQVHAESAPGQFKIALPTAAPLEAIDGLLYVREVVAQYASEEGYKMTLHGNAAHVHISLANDKGNDPAVYESIYAGILTHLRAICAFTFSSRESYDRVADGCWAGGRYVAWGTQSREAPFWKVGGSHWELKCMDGMANPYLALAAVLLAGLDGVRKKTVLGWGDCGGDPATLSGNEGTRGGIRGSLPGSLPEAFWALAMDDVLREGLGAPLVSRYMVVKEGEMRMLDAMGPEEARQWMRERY